jgi:hypothetical protein
MSGKVNASGCATALGKFDADVFRVWIGEEEGLV